MDLTVSFGRFSEISNKRDFANPPGTKKTPLNIGAQPPSRTHKRAIRSMPLPTNKCLLVSHSFPPTVNPAALRVSKFMEYLPDCGWNPIVLTSNNPDRGIRDRCILEANDPGASAKDSARVTIHGSSGLKAKLLRQVKSLAFPDKDFTWVPFAAKKLIDSRSTLLGNVKVVFSSSPSISNHLVGWFAARLLGAPWVADFRDPWTQWFEYDSGPVRVHLDQWTESFILRQASAVTVVTDDTAKLFSSRHDLIDRKVHIVRNGFDPTDYPSSRQRSECFSLVHAGSFYRGTRDPTPILDSMSRLAADGTITPDSFRLTLIGRPEPEIRSLVSERRLEPFVTFTGALPFNEALALQAQATALLLICHMEQPSVPLKFYDYLGARRPILCIADPDFEVSQMVRDAGGYVLPPGSGSLIDSTLRMLLLQDKTTGVKDTEESRTHAYTRQESSRLLSDLFFSLTSDSQK